MADFIYTPVVKRATQEILGEAIKSYAIHAKSFCSKCQQVRPNDKRLKKSEKWCEICEKGVDKNE
jgi:hypothetical protein